jgi:anti-sigma B factor antagonist
LSTYAILHPANNKKEDVLFRNFKTGGLAMVVLINDVHVLAADRSLNYFNWTLFSQQADCIVSNPRPRIVVDLSKTEFIDSEGFGVLVKTFIKARRRNGTLKLACVNEKVREMLKRTCLDHLFEIYGNVESACLSFNENPL